MDCNMRTFQNPRSGRLRQNSQEGDALRGSCKGRLEVEGNVATGGLWKGFPSASRSFAALVVFC